MFFVVGIEAKTYWFARLESMQKPNAIWYNAYKVMWWMKMAKEKYPIENKIIIEDWDYEKIVS